METNSGGDLERRTYVVVEVRHGEIVRIEESLDVAAVAKLGSVIALAPRQARRITQTDLYQGAKAG